MNYIGSKLSLLSFLEESINKVIDNKCKIFCDLFAGTGIVGTHFKKQGFSIIANDIQYYSYVLNRNCIGNHKKLKFSKLIKAFPEVAERDGSMLLPDDDIKVTVCNYLSKLKGHKGFIYKHYCHGGTQGKEQSRQYFSDENGMLCDAIRHKIEEWKNDKLINNNEYYFLIASLIKSVDKYANTTSVYAAFLKNIKNSAKKKLIVKPAEFFINDQEHTVLNDDINNLVGKVKGDIFYLDPPYNQRQYATNYHLLETIAKYDNPAIHGKTGLREYESQKSSYCSKVQAMKSFKHLILQAQARYIFLSYNNEGIMSHQEIEDIMSLRGKYGYFTKEYSRYKADNNREYLSDKTTEYLHYVVCH
ncbi:MAG: DNA adenine methylase [Candidatus Portiera sp.]|nr:DNA adenine methylase [Portiera sp.]